MKRDFLRLTDRTAAEYRALFARTRELKQRRREGKVETALAGRSLALVFEKPSTRTRLSFEAAMFQMGGSAIALPIGESQIPRGEPIRDTARVISSYVDVIAMRTFGDDRLAEMAKYSRVPVLNALSDGGHPVQLLADLFTIEERLGAVEGSCVAFVGDGSSNMARSWVEAARVFGFELKLAAPEDYRPPREELELSKQHVALFTSPAPAVKNADVIATDVWTSMGQEAETAKRKRDFAGYCVDEALLAQAKPGCIVLHCLPAHRGEEITDAVMEGKSSAIFDEAENRLHVQKALLEDALQR